MSKTVIDDGDYAFPNAADHKSGWDATYGMSLRDWFAGQALSGEFAAQNEVTGSIPDNASDEWMVGRAAMLYRMADAMIAARKGGVK